MNSELRCAAEQILRTPAGYCDCSVLLAKAYLSANPPDSNEAIDIAWLESVGFVDGRRGQLDIAIGKVSGECFASICDSVRRFDYICIDKQPETRRDVRRLCECLGITLKEPPCS